MHKDNTGARSRNHFCSAKAISVTNSACESVALFIQHSMRKRHVFICGLRDSTVFFHIISKNGTIFGEELLNTIFAF